MTQIPHRALVALVALVAGCGLPASVSRVQPNAAVQGIPYLLKRPSYVVAVRLDPKSIIDVAPEANQSIVNLCNEGPLALGCPETSDVPPYCIRNRSAMEVVIRQTMDGPPVLYQVGAPDFLTGLGNSFAETDFSLTLTEEGALTAVSAGATDRSLEFIQTVASIAVSAAKSTAGAGVAADAPERLPADCFVVSPDKLPNYVRRLRELLKAQAALTTTLDRNVTALATLKPTELKRGLAGIEALRTQRAAVETQLGELILPLDRKSYTLVVGGKPLNTGADSLFTITLTNPRFSQEGQ